MQGTHQQRGGGSSASARPTSDEPRNRQPPITERQGEEPGYKSRPPAASTGAGGGKGGSPTNTTAANARQRGGYPLCSRMSLQRLGAEDPRSLAGCGCPLHPLGPLRGWPLPLPRRHGPLGNAASVTPMRVPWIMASCMPFDGARRLVGISIAHEALLAAGGDIDVFDVRDRVENSPKLALNRGRRGRPTAWG